MLAVLTVVTARFSILCSQTLAPMFAEDIAPGSGPRTGWPGMAGFVAVFT